MDTSFLPSSSWSSSSTLSTSSLMYSTTQTDSLLVRSRDAIARLTNDLSVATSRITALENEINNLREQNTILKKDITSLTVAESSMNRLLQDQSTQQQELETNYQQRLHTLENDLRTQKEATNAALVASQGSTLTAKSYEEKYHTLSHELSDLQQKYHDKEQESYSHRRLIGELRDRLTTTLEERDEARHEIDRLHHESSLLKKETKASDTSASNARNECRHALQRVQEMENLVSKLEAEASSAREQAVAERTRCINLETNMKEGLTRWLMSIRTKFAGIPLHPPPSSSSLQQQLHNNHSKISNSSTTNNHHAMFGNTEIPLPPSPILESGNHPPTDDKILAWLEALPDVAAWFQRASLSLTNQIEHRLQLASTAVDRLATRLVNHDNTEHRLCINTQALAEQRGQEIEQLKKEIIRYQNEIPPLKFSNSSLEEETSKYQKIAQEAIERAERAEQKAERSSGMAKEAALAADEAIATKNDLETAMKRLQSAWEERDRALRNEITSLENEFTAAERAWANELTETRDRLSVAIKRIKHTKQFVIPQAIKTSLASEIDRSGALVRDAQAVVRACRAHSERILTFLRSSNHGIIQEPAWMSQVRASMAAETSAAASFAEATENLTRVVQQYVAMGVNTTMQENMGTIGGDIGFESSSPGNPPTSSSSLRDRISTVHTGGEEISFPYPKSTTFIPFKTVPHTSSSNVNNSIPNMSYMFGNSSSSTTTVPSQSLHYPEISQSLPPPTHPSAASMSSSTINNYHDYRLQQELLAYGNPNSTPNIDNNPFQNALPAHLSSNSSSVVNNNGTSVVGLPTSSSRHRALQSGMVEYVQELANGSNRDNMGHNNNPSNPGNHHQPHQNSSSSTNENNNLPTTLGPLLPLSSTTMDNSNSSSVYRPVEEVDSLQANHNNHENENNTSNDTYGHSTVPSTVQHPPPLPSSSSSSSSTHHFPSSSVSASVVPVTQQPLAPSHSSYSSSQSTASVISQTSLSSPSVTLTNFEDNEWKLRRQRQLQSHTAMNTRLKALGLDASNTSINGVPFQPLPISGALGGGVPFIGLQPATVQPSK